MSNTTNKEKTAKLTLNLSNHKGHYYLEFIEDGRLMFSRPEGYVLVNPDEALKLADFIALQLSAPCKEKEEWVPISEYDTEARNYVMRWHRIWNCPVCVCVGKGTMAGNWVEKTLTTQWPDNSFEPFFTSIPSPPIK